MFSQFLLYQINCHHFFEHFHKKAKLLTILCKYNYKINTTFKKSIVGHIDRELKTTREWFIYKGWNHFLEDYTNTRLWKFYAQTKNQDSNFELKFILFKKNYMYN
jgi:hypothetical protein